MARSFSTSPCTARRRTGTKRRRTTSPEFWINSRTNPALCHHLEMETYTWEVLPPELLRARSVTDQLVAECELDAGPLAERGLADFSRERVAILRAR